MPENTSNPLYQNIQSTAEEVKNLYTNQPTFMNTIQNGVVNNDPTLNSNVNDYSSAVDELFAHDKNIANANLSDPMFSQGNAGYVSDPMAREKLDAASFANKGERVASSLNRLEKRKIFLAGLVDKAVKLYEDGISGKIDERDYDLKLKQLGETIRSNKKNEEIAAAKLTGVSDTGDETVDSLSDEQAIALANKLGYNFTGGTKTERMAKIRGALSEYNQTGKFNYKYLTEQLGTKTTDSLSALTDVITRSDELTKTLDTKENLTGPVKGRTSGFLSKYFGKSSKASMVGKELEEMSADKIKERYGGALTTTEVQRLTKQAITQRNVQEADNVQSLAIMKKNAINLLREKLKSNGWSDAQIEGYLTQITGSSQAADNRPSLDSFNK